MEGSFFNMLEERAEKLEIVSPGPLILDPDSIFVIISGKASLFAVKIFQGEVIGRRKFLFSLQQEEAVFSPPDESMEISWVLVPSPESHIIRLPEAKFISMVQEGIFTDDIAALLKDWLNKILNSLAEEIPPPRNAVNIESGKSFQISSGTSFIAKDDVIWVELSGENNSFLGNKIFSVSRTIFSPLNNHAWILAEEDITAKAVDIFSLLSRKEVWESLKSFHLLAQEVLSMQRRGEEAAEMERIRSKEEGEYSTIEKSVSQLSTIVEDQKKLKDNLMSEISREKNHLMACCRMIGASTGIDFVTPSSIIKGISSRDPLGDIVRASRVRMREVILDGKWWNDENGSLLAHMEEDGRPVALIQLKHGKYELYDPAQNERLSVDGNIAGQLKPFGHIFYRPFPVKSLAIKDIFNFGFAAVSKADLLNVFILGIAGGLLGIVIPIAIGVLFNTIIPEMDRGQLYYMTLILIGSALAAFLFGVTQSVAMLRIESKMQSSIQASVWDRLLDLPVTFFRRFSSGDLAHRALSIHAISQMLSGVALGTILSGIFSVFSLALLFFYDVTLAFVALGMILIALITSCLLGRYQVSYQRELMDVEGKSLSLVLQIFRGIAKFRVAGAESRAFYLWATLFKQLRRLTYRARINEILLDLFNNFFPIIASAVLFIVVIVYSGNSLTPGSFIAFNAAFTSFLLAMISMSTVLISVLNLFPLYERARPIFEALPEVNEAKIDPGELNGEIEVDNLCFRYDPEGPLILNDISLKIKPGEFIGLVGSSGCGKSTLFRCLLGFEKWESGMIYYDGQSMDSIDVTMVRRLVGVVLQNGKLMAADIFTNICGSSSMNTINDAWDAARGAGLEDDIRQMPMGMHTFINEGATTISGGQRQRLLIARAIVNKPRIIYFDEATSALDNKTQATVSRTLDSLQATRVVIAHRLSTIINADRIFVMDKGRIVQSGTYKELMEQEGLFAELAKRQLA